MGTLKIVRTMEDAREALAEVLELPQRTAQIILIMEKIMLCRTHETRRFVTDAMAGLIEGGLDDMRKKRRDALEARARREPEMEAQRLAEEEVLKASQTALEASPGYTPGRRQDFKDLEAQIKKAMQKRREDTMRKTKPAPAPEPVPEPEPEVVPATAESVPTAPTETRLLPIVIVPSNDEIKNLEDLGTEIDALSLAAVAREIFPDLKSQYEPWQVARAIYMDEQAARACLLQGARLKDHERATMLAPALDELKRLIENHRPWWATSLPTVKEIIDGYFKEFPAKEGGADPQNIFDVIAMSDDRAMDMLQVIKKDNLPGVDFVAKLRKRLDDLLEFEAERAK